MNRHAALFLSLLTHQSSPLAHVIAMPPSNPHTDHIDRRIDKLETQIGAIHNEIIRAHTDFSAKSTAASNVLGSVQEATRSISNTLTSCHETGNLLKQRVPPLVQTAAVAVAALALLGFSYTELRESAKGVANIAPKADAAVQSLTQGATQLASVATGVQSQQQTLMSDLKVGQDAIHDLSSSLQALQADVGKLRQTMLQLLAKASTSDVPGRRKPSLPGPHNPLFEFLRAQELVEAGEYQQAIDIIGALPPTGDTNEKCARLIVQGNAAQGLHDFEKAVGHFANARDLLEAAQASVEARAAAHNNLGSAYYSWAVNTDPPSERADLLASSRQSLLKALSLSPTSPEIHTNMMITMLAQGYAEEAIAVASSYTGSRPPEMMVALAAAQAKLHLVHDAIESLISIGPDIAPHVMSIAADPDFRDLREDATFRDLLQQNSPASLFAMIVAAWEEASSTAEASTTKTDK